MKFPQNIIEKSLEILLPLLGALCVLLPVSPLNMQLAYRDSGVFLYTGWRIVNGELPYRDVWDHKPPVIFYLDALGLALSNYSRWGVWLVELVLLFAAAWIGFLLIKRIFGFLPSLFSLLLWLLTLTYILQGGNFTTEYTLPLQFAALFLIYHAEKSKHPDWDFFLIGLTGAIAFFTKQTAIGIWISIVVVLTLQRLLTGRARQWSREILFLLLGGFSFSALVILFFAAQDALPQFWSAAFAYNFAYSARTSKDFIARLETILKGIRPLTQAGLFQIAMLGYVLSVVLLLTRKSSLSKASLLLLIGLLALPLEFILITLPGRTFSHYYMTLLPILALFAAVTVWWILSWVPAGKTATIVTYAAVLVIAGWIAWSSFDDYLNQVYTYRDFAKNQSVITYIQENTTSGEQVLLWGSEASINYFSQRKSPSRFVYQAPLQQENYVDEAMINEFLDDVIKNRPKLIIEADKKNPLFSFPLTSESIEGKVASLKVKYCAVRKIDSWQVYEYAENGCSQ